MLIFFIIFFWSFFETGSMITIQFHCVEKSDINILQNVYFCVLRRKRVLIHNRDNTNMFSFAFFYRISGLTWFSMSKELIRIGFCWLAWPSLSMLVNALTTPSDCVFTDHTQFNDILMHIGKYFLNLASYNLITWHILVRVQSFYQSAWKQSCLRFWYNKSLWVWNNHWICHHLLKDIQSLFWDTQ